MTFALCQTNPTVGDLPGNAAQILRYARCAAHEGADLAVFPELGTVGYPPMDLLESPAFLDDVERVVAELAAALPPALTVILGAPLRNSGPVGKRLFNAALVLKGGRVVDRTAKLLLPTYDVFDEFRHFEPADRVRVVPVEAGGRTVRLGLHLCEDMWNNENQAPQHLYRANPIDELAEAGCDVFVNISASPFAVGKQAERAAIIAESCVEHGLPFVYVNQVGANTEIVFDGDSRVHAADGRTLGRLPSFREGLALWTLGEETVTTFPAPPIWPGLPSGPEGTKAHQAADRNAAPENGQDEGSFRDLDPPRAADIAQIHDALVLGIADYVRKTGLFEQALVGLSGGIDSAVTCALAVAALGPDRVVGVTMPSAYSSAGSVADSRALAQNLGIVFHEVPIVPAVDAFGAMLEPLFRGTEEGVAEENIQARARGLTLMALSNKFGHLLLTTGNKSEMAVGYATLYGDMSGGLAVLADVFKTEVYALAEHINARAGYDAIPRSTITKPPSAELRPDQTDQDSLPPYDVLDAILERYVEEKEDLAQIVTATGYDEALVRRILGLVDRNEYKRRQAAPGLRVSNKAFGVGRRIPIVMKRVRHTGGPILEAEVVDASGAVPSA